MDAAVLRASRQQLLGLEDPTTTVAGVDDQARRHLVGTVRRPSLTFQLFVEGAGQRLVHDGWASYEAVVIQPTVAPDVPVDTPCGPLAVLPSTVARLVGLGVRTEPGTAQAVIGRDELRAALADDADLDGLGPVSTVWTLQWRRGTDEPDGLTVIDLGPGGSVWVARAVDDERLVLDEAGTMSVWSRLSRLLSLCSPAPEVGTDQAEPPAAADG